MQTYCVLENHSKEVNCCAFSSDFFATSSGDKTVRVYSAHTFHELPYSPLNDFKYGISYVDFSQSGQLLAAACSDGSAYVFHLTNKLAETHSKLNHSNATTVEVCSFSHNSLLLVTGSSDGSVALWDLHNKKLIKKATGHPEGNVYAAAFTPCDYFMVTGSGLGDLRVWEMASFQVTMQTQAHDEGVSSCGVTCVKFSPTFHTSLSHPNRTYLMATSGQDYKLKLWLFSAQGKCIELFRVLSGHLSPVSRCSFSQDGQTLASCSYDKSIILWSPVSGDQQLELCGHNSIVTSVAFSTFGHLASTSFDKKVIIWRPGVNRVFHETYVPQQSPGQVNQLPSAPPIGSISPNPRPPAASTRPVETWSCDDVISWLTDQLTLGQYAEAFKTNHIDGTELQALTPDNLRNDLGVDALGHRNKIIRAIQLLSNQN